ncbi:hypothetical protein PHYPO_G00171060 [Pangasianodon hypophthalmus]|uniref:Uncharacterized protein n=1 Tax=Pangasianodon hypophthalmus TaxID=310915 RepID=A0A5N5JSB3_PANHP|nr:hypothetical protein PHYPO_G00171060 [Pangasianodon hypophthalmus]
MSVHIMVKTPIKARASFSSSSLSGAQCVETGLQTWASAADVLEMVLQNGLKISPSCFFFLLCGLMLNVH